MNYVYVSFSPHQCSHYFHVYLMYYPTWFVEYSFCSDKPSTNSLLYKLINRCAYFLYIYQK